LHGFRRKSDPVHTDYSIPLNLQLDIKKVCLTKASAALMVDMNAAMTAPNYIRSVRAAIKSLKVDKTPGTSMW
jgi:hypothetical protein